jgi:hypothetical protein
MHESLLTNDDVLNLLFAEVGSTGNAKIQQDGSLMIQAEENSRWMFHGSVEDAASAANIIHDFFLV